MKAKGPINILLVNLSTCFGLGFGYAPGTLGSLVSILIHYLLIKVFRPNQTSTIIIQFFLVVFFSVLGLFSIRLYLRNQSSEDDPKEVIIDEFAGQFMSLLTCSCMLVFLQEKFHMAQVAILHVVCFFLFRLFDILKPWPINLIDNNWKGPVGIIADDLLAGLIAGVLGALLICWIF